jgi:hypothetical protein
MVGDTGDYLAQIGFRIEAIEVGGFDKSIGYGSARAAGTQGKRANRAVNKGACRALTAVREAIP